jgi:hypothetical protein
MSVECHIYVDSFGVNIRESKLMSKFPRNHPSAMNEYDKRMAFSMVHVYPDSVQKVCASSRAYKNMGTITRSVEGLK